jgi:hypothetical protein
LKLQNGVLNFGLFTKLPSTPSPTSRLPAPRLRRRGHLATHTSQPDPNRPRAPTVCPLAVPSGCMGERHASLTPWKAATSSRAMQRRSPAITTPSPRSDLDQAGSTSPRSPKPSPLSVLPYKLEPQADVTGETSVPCPPRQSCRRAELVADRPPQPHIAQTGNTTTLPDLYRSYTTRPPSPTASRAPPHRSRPAAVRPSPWSRRCGPPPLLPRPYKGAA